MKCERNQTNGLTEQDAKLTEHLSGLLRKVLSNHDVDLLADMVLHELGHENGFGLKKATYLVDNPDFDHLLGVAGYHEEECPYHKKDLWLDPACFKTDMQDACYHNHVKKFLESSLKRNDINLKNEKEIKQLAQKLGIDSANFFTWQMKHGNNGILIFEHNDEKPMTDWKKHLFANVASILSFCGI